MTGFRSMIIGFPVSVLALALGSACGGGESRRPLPAASPIAVVKGEPVVRQQFDDYLSLRLGQLEPDSSEPGEKVLFREFLTERLLLQEAAEEQIEEDEIREQLASWLSEGQEVTSALLERARIFLRIQKFVRSKINSQISVSLEEMQDYYEDHEKEFIVEDQAHVLEILLQDRDEVGEIRGQLAFGDVRAFRTLARSRSQGLSAEAGGDLGVFERGQLPEDFERAIFKLKPGEISTIFSSDQGYHLFMLEEWVPRHPQRFYEVQAMIFRRIIAERERTALDQYVNQLFQSASVQIMDADLDWRGSSGDLD